MSTAWLAKARQLDVFLNDDLLGHLYEHQDVWAFRYDTAWLTQPDIPPGNALELRNTLELCRALPLQPDLIIDTPTQRPVFWFFENLLPEEQALAAVATQAQLKPEQVFELLGWLGAESAGALTLLPPGRQPPAAGRRALSNANLQNRLRSLPTGSLVAGMPKHMSLAGAQYKLPVIYDAATKELYEPVGAEPSTHILKPQHPHAWYAHSVHNEYFCMRLAAAIGLPAPSVWLHSTGNETIYLIERFDRRRLADGTLNRIFALDACQLLGIARRNKYDESTLENLRICIDQLEAPAVARRQILTWIAFNLLIGNGDAHLKNLTFLRERNAWRPAPAYDLVSTAVYRIIDATEHGQRDGLSDERMTMAINDEKHFLRIKREHLRRAASAIGASPRAMDAVLDDLLAVIEPRADALLAEISASAFSDPGAMRTLRQIRHSVIGRLATNLQR